MAELAQMENLLTRLQSKMVLLGQKKNGLHPLLDPKDLKVHRGLKVPQEQVSLQSIFMKELPSENLQK